ncbi:MAG: DUF72 domain-containing protein [Myxococcales bacterium]|nr:DUF72 domain-containing protein [Myxococcales bacterium]
MSERPTSSSIGAIECDPDRLAAATALAERAPRPARVRNVLVGTAGWTDPGLIASGRFYPRDARSAEDRLRYYGRHFSLVEVDATYYVLPSAPTARLWVERTPSDFVFDIKAFSLLTGHAVDATRLPSDLRAALPESARVAADRVPDEVLEACWERFVYGISPLREANKLGAILLQFPPWFDATRGHAKVVERARARLEGHAVSIEFRHASWGEPARFDRVVHWLRELRAAYVCVDEPQGHANSMPAHVAVADRSLAVARFHGRREAVWDKAVSVQEKYAYLYSPEELAPWSNAVATLSGEAESVHVVFNNCNSNYAVLGAKDLTAELVDAFR